MARILLTGFQPFHNASSNPSQSIVEALSGESNLVTRVLPVVFGESSREICNLIDEIAPDFVLALGQAEGRRELTPERVAINIDDARIPDNAGNQPRETAIESMGPAAYFSTLPIVEMVSSMRAANLPAAISNTAGTFVCNHIFYAMQHHCRDRQIRSGFMHLPLMTSQAEEFPGLPTLDFELMLKGVRAALEVLR